MSLRTAALVAAALVVIGVLENTFFGADTGGAKHEISVAFFLVAVVAFVALLGIGVLALVRRGRRTDHVA